MSVLEFGLRSFFRPRIYDITRGSAPVGAIDKGKAHVVKGADSVYRLALKAAADGVKLKALVGDKGLGRAIDRQFDAWGLTPAEREVALLVLKGHGHKQIAGLTGRSERTVRQHAVTVYGKAGLGGRAELAAFFLQDLMLPPGSGGAPTS